VRVFDFVNNALLSLGSLKVWDKRTVGSDFFLNIGIRELLVYAISNTQTTGNFQ
jgi:hypothetical protein